ncbi:MAG: hypothetical protein HY840_08655 [Bacteroidetes bacterium]|nr:hypothetical protein [Bacteroidota bacterium]
MKHILLFTLFISASLLSFSQRSKIDTFNIFQNKKKEKRDAVKEIQSHPLSKQDSVYYIKYGKNSTKCTGYCFHEATVDSIHIVTLRKSLQAEKNYPAKMDTAQTTPTQWSMLINSIEINSFFSIPEKIGNPGVDEENTEWIELNYAGKIHRVTFDSTGPDEYDGIKNLLKIFKTIAAF